MHKEMFYLYISTLFQNLQESVYKTYTYLMFSYIIPNTYLRYAYCLFFRNHIRNMQVHILFYFFNFNLSFNTRKFNNQMFVTQLPETFVQKKKKKIIVVDTALHDKFFFFIFLYRRPGSRKHGSVVSTHWWGGRVTACRYNNPQGGMT